MYEIRLYQDDQVKTIPLNPTEEISFGEGKSCSCILPEGSCPGSMVTFSFQNGSWEAECRGTVLYEGKPAGHIKVRNGDMLVLNRNTHLAVQLAEKGEEPEAEISLTGMGELLIGRASGCALQLNHKRVSSSHAKVYQNNGQWRIGDVNSTNGTFVKGKKIRDCVLKEGDQIVIGPYGLILAGGMLQVYGKKGTVLTALPKEKHPVREEYPYFVRSPRLTREQAAEELEIEGAPSIGSRPEVNWLSVLLPSLGGVGLMLVLTVLTGLSPVGLIVSGPMAVLGVIMTVINYRKQTKDFSQMDTLRREKYETYLSKCEEQLRSFAAEQREIALSSNPNPEDCIRLADNLDAKLWVRTPRDGDFLSLRAGLGEEPLGMTVRTPKLGLILEEDEFTRRPEKLADRYRTVSGIPVTVDLLRYSRAGIVGNRGKALNAVRCLAVQLTTQHSYEEVKLAVIFPREEYEQWSWMRWLPHTFNNSRTERYMACTPFEAARLLERLTEECRGRKKDASDLFAKTKPAIPHYVIIVGDGGLIRGPGISELLDTPGVSCIWMAPSVASLPQGVDQILEFSPSAQLYMREQASDRKTFQPDEMSPEACERFARSVAPVRLRRGKQQGIPDSVTFLEGYHVSRTEELEIEDFWQNSRCEKTLSVPIGVRENGENYYFDIHEKKDGPHGLVAGTSGSGKSEMAQSWIASMALQFSPDDVNFILVDFKGTSLLQPFLGLPHLAGSISNLDEDIGRCLMALESEMERRQRLFDQERVTDIRGYLSARRKNPSMEKVPFLILVIDEFAEFKAQFPDFSEPLNHIFRGGRSLGVYTMIMTQKPSGVVTEQMNANANFRWCLKVQSESDSRDMLGVSDAAYLNVPGRSYVKSGDGVLEMIQPFYSGAEYRPDSSRKEIPPVCTVSLAGERKPVSAAPAGNMRESRGKQIDAVVTAIAAYCRRKGIAPARQLWTKPLPDSLELAEIQPEGRLWKSVSDWKPERKGAEGVFGLIDDPMHQTQVPLVHDFWKNGNLLVYGMALSGKTTFLKSLLISMCCSFSPEQVQFYLMEFGSFNLRSMEKFPHVGGAAGEDEPETLERIARRFSDELSRRKKLFRKWGVGTIGAYQDASGESLPAMILAADNLNLMGVKFPEIQETLAVLTREGEAFGLYAAATVTGSTGLSYQLKQNFKTVMALQMTDRLEYSQLVGRVSGNIPKPVIGRGLVQGPLEFQTAIAGKDLTDGQRAALIRQLAEEMTAAWDGPLPVPVLSMPDEIPYGSVKGGPLALGFSYGETAPAVLPVKEHTSLLISCGDQKSRNQLLALFFRQAAEMKDGTIIAYGPFAGELEDSRSLQKAADGAELGNILRKLAPVLQERQTEKKKEENREFSHIFIFADGVKELTETADNRVISQLEAFIRLGTGLGITVIAADLAADAERCYFGRNILMETLHEGPMILAGGQAEDHRIADIPALKRILPKEGLREDIVLVMNGKCVRIRPMDAAD